MKHIYRLLLFSSVVALVVFSPAAQLPSASSQSELYTCPQIVETALTTAKQFCDDTGRNQACYGHIQLDTQPQPGVRNFVFDNEGDVVDVSHVQTLRLSAMDPQSGRWGVALMRFQANLPTNQPNQNATLVLFGNVEIDTVESTATLIDVMSTISGNANIRLSPSSSAPVIGKLAPQETLMATGRLEDSSWVRVQMADGQNGWISAELVTSDEEIDTLDVVEHSSTYYGPMQAFYLNNTANDATCPQAPNSGILIQTPEGEAEVNLLINEVNIQIGSTVYFQATPGNEMTISVVEGMARVTTDGVTEYVPAGTQLEVPMDEDLHPAGPPTQAHPYRMEDVSALPISLLEREITIHPPLQPEDIDEAIAEKTGEDTTPPGLDGNLPPGQSGENGSNGQAGDDETTGDSSSAVNGWETAPGLNGNVPPGQGSETPPGQTGTNGNAGGNGNGNGNNKE
jgi:hypothetical protein